MSTDPLAAGQRPALDADPEAAPFPEDPRLRVMRRLVNALLVVMIAGVLSITVAILVTLKRFNAPPVAGLAEQERIVAADATTERVTLVVENTETGARRVVILDGRTLRPLAGIEER